VRTAEDATEYVVDTARSRFEVWGEDIMSGDHRITFMRWSARVRKTKEPEIHAEIAMCSAVLDMPRANGILRYELLECDEYPRSTLDATMRPSGATPGEQLVEGISELHGVRKKLRFTGLLREEGAAYRFTAAFVISRKTFNIRYAPAEPFLKDDVRVIIDVIAVPAARAPAPLPTSPSDEARPPPMRTWGRPDQD
jgi:polyisoprenoid-binding protein YceI